MLHPFGFSKGKPDFLILDNLGLMPYRRQIIAVSELTDHHAAVLEPIA